MLKAGDPDGRNGWEVHQEQIRILKETIRGSDQFQCCHRGKIHGQQRIAVDVFTLDQCQIAEGRIRKHIQ